MAAVSTQDVAQQPCAALTCSTACRGSVGLPGPALTEHHHGDGKYALDVSYIYEFT